MICLNKKERSYINEICGDKYYLLKKAPLKELNFSKLYRGLVVSNFMNKYDGNVKREKMPEKIDKYISYIKEN